MNKKLWIGVGLAAVLLVGWALFRPELLLVNRTVSEKFPAAVGGSRITDATTVAFRPV
jgi:multisubunit Na+/H+ antiporter MnhB subunit